MDGEKKKEGKDKDDKKKDEKKKSGKGGMLAAGAGGLAVGAVGGAMLHNAMGRSTLLAVVLRY